MSGKLAIVRSGPTLILPPWSVSVPVRFANVFPRGETVTPPGPYHGFCRDAFCGTVDLKAHPVSINVLDHGTHLRLHSELGERSLGLLRQVLGKGREESRGRIQQNDLRFFRVYGTEVVLQRLPCDFADRPR